MGGTSNATYLSGQKKTIKGHDEVLIVRNRMWRRDNTVIFLFKLYKGIRMFKLPKNIL